MLYQGTLTPTAQVRFALTYPELYEVGSSNLGHLILYGLLNRAEGVLCDRAYFPGTHVCCGYVFILYHFILAP